MVVMGLQLRTDAPCSLVLSFPAGMGEESGTDGDALSQGTGGLSCRCPPDIAAPSRRLRDWPAWFLFVLFFFFFLLKRVSCIDRSFLVWLKKNLDLH